MDCVCWRSTMTVDVFELLSLALLNPYQQKQQKERAAGVSHRFSFLLQQLQQKLAAAAKGPLALYLLRISTALLKDDSKNPKAPRSLYKVHKP